MSSSRDVINQLTSHLSSSPASIQQIAIDLVEESYNSEFEITDATSAFVKLLECSSTNTAAAMTKAESLSRREFPMLAQTIEDLYPHMSDQDHLGRFGTPASDVPITLALYANYIRDNAVDDPSLGLKRITFPKDTTVSVAGTDFYFHHPLDLLVSNDGEIKAFWNLSEESPLKQRASNVVKSEMTYIDREEVFVLHPNCDQITVISETIPVSTASGFNNSFSFKDQYYHARVFYTTDNVTWTEMLTSFDQQVHDITKPTAVLSVTGNLLNVKIPEIYITNNLVGTNIRVDVFSTKGALSLDLSDYINSSWSINFNDFGEASALYATPLYSVTMSTIISNENINRGTNGLTFEELRSRVVNGTDQKKVPVTFPELKQYFKDIGMGIERQKDTVTGRSLVATKKLSTPVKTNLSSGAGVAAVNIRVDETRKDLQNHMIDVNNKTVIKPNALYQGDGGNTEFMTDQEVMSFNALSGFEKADQLNVNDLFYSPFHYIIDKSNPVTAVRAYYLAKPSVESVNYVNLNTDLGFIVNTSTSKLTYDEDTQIYRLEIRATTPGNGSDIRAVINYTDPISGDQWDLVAQPVIIDSETTEFVFELGCMLDLDVEHKANFSGLKGDVVDLIKFNIESTELDLVYVLPDAGTTPFDNVLAQNDLVSPFTAIAHETIRLNFGRHLDGLYSSVRKTITTPIYKTHKEDVIQTWLKTVRVPKYNPDKTIDFSILHEIGDPVVIDGEPVLLHEKGTRVLDPLTNEPELEIPSGLSYDVRMLLIDASYKYADTVNVQVYRDSIPVEILRTLDNEIANAKSDIIEETKLFFEPVSDKVKSNVQLDSEKRASIDTSLSFKVSVRLTKSANELPKTKDLIRAGIKKVILEELTNREFYLSRLYARLTKVSPVNVNAIEVDSPIPGANMAILLEDNASFTLASKVLVLSNGELDVVDDVDISFTT